MPLGGHPIAAARPLADCAPNEPDHYKEITTREPMKIEKTLMVAIALGLAWLAVSDESNRARFLEH